MTKPATRIVELEDDELEEFVEIFAERKSKDYVEVERIGGANDKGRDVIGFLSRSRHEGDWDLYQCKRKTRGSKLRVGEAMTELGKVFHHHDAGAYATLPRRYVFVSPRGMEGSLTTMLLNPSLIRKTLLETWDKNCRTRITGRNPVELTAGIRALIEAYDFSAVECLTAPKLAKDPAALPALVQVLRLPPGEAPEGETPDEVSDTELTYIAQLRDVYAGSAGSDFATLDDVFAHPRFGEHLRIQRQRYYQACAFRDFHRDNTAARSVDVFKNDIYHLLIDVYNEEHPSPLARIDAVMKHTGAAPAGILGTMARPPVKQGTCHHLVSDGKIRWSP
ncbi:ABC-three component system protein [Bosea sp. ASV33]|uniref:ABC-three component system protein n=1 Tax=Bosea sp. ASV33 TaxID=2795106 RepID=UPI0018EDB1A1|nr:ABC-three component system protein [Bosea sp. ASV33]